MTNDIFDIVIANAIENADKARKEDQINTNDYLDDKNLLRCGKCHGYRTTMFTNPLTGKTKIVSCMCKCRIIEEEKRRHIEKVYELKKLAFKDPEYAKMVFDVDKFPESKASKISRKYVENWSEMYKNNIGLIFQGDCGVGKTFYSTCIANELIEKEVSVYETNLPDLISSLSKNFGEERDIILNKVSKVSWLILDDVGIERNTDFSLEKYYEIIDTRYRSKRPIIISTNLSIEELNTNDTKYQRIYHRLMEMAQLVKVEGQNVRGNFMARKNIIAQDLLGL